MHPFVITTNSHDEKKQHEEKVSHTVEDGDELQDMNRGEPALGTGSFRCMGNATVSSKLLNLPKLQTESSSPTSQRACP